MKLRTLIYSWLAAIIFLLGQAHADIITFQLDSISSGVTSDSIQESFLTLSISDPSSSNGTISAQDINGNRGLVYDYQSIGFVDMWAVNVSFDKDATIIGYSIATVGSNGFTFGFGSQTGLNANVGDYVLATPIDLASGQTMSIRESSGDGLGSGYAIISSITVQAIPEPSALLILGICGLAVNSRRRRI